MKRLVAPVAVVVVLLIGLTVALAARAPAPPHLPGSAQSPAASVLWTRSVTPNADSTAAYLPRVLLRTGQHRPTVFVLAGNNGSNCSPGDPVRRSTLYAFDAVTGAPRWTHSTSGPSRCTTAAPAAAGGWVYAPGLDGKVHRYRAGTGAEDRGGGWPHAYTLMPEVEKEAADLRISGKYLYITTSGFIGDQGHYQGHLETINLRTGAVHVFNSLCSNVHQLLGPIPGRANYCSYQQSGLFGRGQAVTDPQSGDVYIVSGNGPWNGRTNWGDSVLKLDPSGARLLDAFTPTNQASLDSGDADLGSTGPALFPPITAGGKTYHLLVQGGKGPACDSCSGVALRLLNRDNLSGHGGPGHLGGDLVDTQAPGGCEVLTAPAMLNTGGAHWVFYANDCGVAGYRVTVASPGTFHLDRIWSSQTGGTTPVIAGGVLYVARGGTLRALDPTSGRQLGQTGIGDLHWEYPLIAGHRLYLSDQSGRLVAYRIASR